MSYQPQQPPPGMGGLPQPPGVPGPPQAPYYAPVPVPVPAPTPAAQRGTSGGKGLKLAGALVLVLGLVAGVALFLLSGSAKEETVKKFARAPVGCTTTLEFDETGSYTLYVETKGSVPELGGDCAGSGGSYDRADDDLPLVTLTLTGPDGQQIALGPDDGSSYDAGGYVGRAVNVVQIDTTGSHQLTVTSDDTDFAIAVGGDPEADSSAMQTMGLIAAAAGVVLGGLLLFLGMRKKGGPAPTAPSTAWQQGPASVPGWQPQASVPGVQPPYQQPAPPYQQPPPPPTPPATGWGAPHP